MVFSNDIPFPDFIEVQTIRKFHRGMLRNGIHEGEEISLDVYLDIYHGRSKTLCRSCGSDIKPGDICGDGNYKGDGIHCVNCIAVPPTVEGWEITYKMKRKSRQHPSGFRSQCCILFVVPFPLPTYWLTKHPPCQRADVCI